MGNPLAHASTRAGQTCAVHFSVVSQTLRRPSEGSAVRLASSKHGPDDPCVLVGECDCCAVEAAPLPKLVDPLVVEIGFVWAVRTTARAPCTSRLRRCWLPRFDVPIKSVRSPLENCRGTRPTQAARCRPFLNSEPSPIAATIAVAVFGPMPLIFGNALTRFPVEKDPFGFLVEHCDSSIEVSKEIEELASRAIAVSSLSKFSRICGIRRRAQVILFASAKPRSSKRPRIWLTSAVR